MVIIRYLFVLLVGFLGGGATTLWLVQSGTGDFVIRRTEAVQDLERRLREMELQRDALGRQLEDVLARSARMERTFEDLERRFRGVVERSERGLGAERPGVTAPGAPVPGTPVPPAPELAPVPPPTLPGGAPREPS